MPASALLLVGCQEWLSARGRAFAVVCLAAVVARCRWLSFVGDEVLWLAGVPGWGGRIGVPWAGAPPWPVPLPVELSGPPRRGSGVVVSGVPDSHVAVAHDHPG